jgi:predicted lipoprotein with Yx(FWY)xxD motif
MRHPKIIISSIGLAAVHIASANVAGRTETILVNFHGPPLYTFADDHSGQVTGQDVQNFFVATPGLTSLTTSSAPAGTVPAVPLRKMPIR